MRIDEINDPKEFLALKDTWDELLQRCDHTIFSTWEWLTIWWKHFGDDKKLVLLLAQENGDILGIAPLMYSVHKMFGLRMGKIEFIGTPDSDYNDFVLTKKSEECIKLFIEYLNDIPEKWDCIDLTDMPEHAKSTSFLSKSARKLKFAHVCPYAPLPKNPDIFMNALERTQRKSLRRNLRRLMKDFSVEFIDHSQTQSCQDEMDRFFELHQKRWDSKGFLGVFADQSNRNFHLDIAKSFSQKGWLSLFSLRLSGVPVAAHYGFSYGSKCYSYLSGFDPRYSGYGVGSLLFCYTITECIRKGLSEFDFMRGAEEYKDRWNTLTRWNHKAIIIRRGFLRNAEHWLYNEYWRQGRRFEYIVRNAPRTLADALNKKTRRTQEQE